MQITGEIPVPIAIIVQDTYKDVDVIICLPYGSGHLELPILDDNRRVDLLLPVKFKQKTESDPGKLVSDALSSPLGVRSPFVGLGNQSRIAITVNDKTRPVPNNLLINPLIDKLLTHGVLKENITIFIASGTHLPMRPDEFSLILSDEITQNFKIIPHNCDDETKLYEIGQTNRGTPVAVNRDFINHDLKIVVGDIELHHFAGYSGGVKSAAIGVCSRQTINTNHRLLLDPASTIGSYSDNPLRQDIEEIGRMIGVDLALNAVLDENKQILQVFFGEPLSVMAEGINLVNQISQVETSGLYDVVIASAGGFPKDINLYQAQKAMTHAAQFCRRGGLILLFAECREGTGSQGYLDFMDGLETPTQVIDKFTREGFSVGPHKAYQVARILEKCQVFLRSSIPDLLVNSLLLTPLAVSVDLDKFIQQYAPGAPKIAILPFATAVLPRFAGGKND
jgi:nickel-dependent lactate racemase